MNIVILGSSGIGKTYILRKFFKVDRMYGYKAVMMGRTPVISRGMLDYLPELRGTRTNTVGVKDGFISLMTNDRVSVTDVNTTAPFALSIIRSLGDANYITLTATDDEVSERILSRRSAPNATLSKAAVIQKTIKQRDRDVARADKVMTQEELLSYLEQEKNKNEDYFDRAIWSR